MGDTMTISLIPNKEPGGPQTQQIEAQTAEAGLSQTVGQAPPNFRNLQPPTPRSPREFDALESRTPQNSGRLRQDTDSRIIETLAQSPSPQMRDLAQRLRGF
jgi:hypothetical protein